MQRWNTRLVITLALNIPPKVFMAGAWIVIKLFFLILFMSLIYFFDFYSTVLWSCIFRIYWLNPVAWRFLFFVFFLMVSLSQGRQLLGFESTCGMFFSIASLITFLNLLNLFQCCMNMDQMKKHCYKNSSNSFSEWRITDEAPWINSKQQQH